MCIVGGMEKGHAPPFLPIEKGTDVVSYHLPADESAMLCNAILKEPFPPVSLPKREYMENAKKSGKSWACRSSDRRCHGSDTRSANGTKSWITSRACRPRPPFRNRRKVKSGKGESEVTCYFALTISASEFRVNPKPGDLLIGAIAPKLGNGDANSKNHQKAKPAALPGARSARR